MRLNKFLASSGVASRRACDDLIFGGEVKINGETEKSPATQVNVTADKVTVNGQLIKACTEKVYLMLNKPVGYTCSNKRAGEEKLAVDLFPREYGRLFTIGRLDKKTSGLLLVTNDGDFSQDVIHPSKNVVKEYLVKCKQEIFDTHLKSLSEGMYIENRKIVPVNVIKVRRGTLKITVKEGKKHEVRLLCEKAKIKIWQLKRIRVGNVTLGPLKEGQFRHLSVRERKLFG